MAFSIAALSQDASVYASYTGHYKISDTAVLTVSQDRTRLLGKMTGQPAIELAPKTPTEFFAKPPVNAYFTFVTDERGRVTALNLYHEGTGSAALPIDDQLAAQIEQRGMQLLKAATAHMQSKVPTPGSESALRSFFAALLEGKPNYEAMTPQFAEVIRRQLVQLQAGAQASGAITSLKFLSPVSQGGDAFQVTHQRGTSYIQISLAPDGKVQGVLLAASPPGMAVTAKAIQGPYQPTHEVASGAPTLRVFHPEGNGRIPRNRWPVVIWAHGGCLFDGPIYTGLLSTIASHGFVVITTTGRAQDGFGDRPETADDLSAAMDWAERENARTGSPLNGRIDTQRIAAMGQSCGGGLAVELGADPRVATTMVFNYGTTGEALKKLHGPVLLVNGHDSDFMMGASKSTYDEINNLPVFYGALHGVGHSGTIIEPGGGEFANVASNWALWQLKGDKPAGTMFVGEKCGLCTSSHWDVASKRLPD